MKMLDRKTRSDLVKLVVFMVVTTLATGVLVMLIGNLNFEKSREYKAIFSDATGVVSGDDVRVAGVKVGSVKKVEIVDRTKARITFTVRDATEVTRSSTATIRYRNLVGQRYIALSQGPGATNRTLPKNGLIPKEQTQPALDLTVLFGGFKPLFQALDPAEVNQLAQEIMQVLQGEGGTVDQLLAHIGSLTTTIASRDAVIGQVVNNLNTVLGTVSQRDTELASLIGELRRFVSGLAADRVAIGQSLGDIDNLASATADLLDKARPGLREDITQLGKTAGTLADNSDVLNGVLSRLPDKLNTITRTASYGSWFNFYLCSLDGRVALPGLALTDDLPTNLRVAVDQARCG